MLSIFTWRSTCLPPCAMFCFDSIFLRDKQYEWSLPQRSCATLPLSLLPMSVIYLRSKSCISQSLFLSTCCKLPRLFLIRQRKKIHLRQRQLITPRQRHQITQQTCDKDDVSSLSDIFLYLQSRLKYLQQPYSLRHWVVSWNYLGRGKTI